MRKRVYNDGLSSPGQLVVSIICFVFFAILFYYTFTVFTTPDDVYIRVALAILYSIFMIIAIIVVAITLIKGFDYWYVTKDAIYYKRPFRRKIKIKFSDIEYVEHTKMQSLHSSKYSPEDVYIVNSKGEQAIIFTDEEGRRKSRKQILKYTIDKLSAYPQR